MFEIDLVRPTRTSSSACFLAFALAVTTPAFAEEQPHGGALAGAEETAPANNLVWAARTCYIEATFREADCVALLWVARKRAERTDHQWLAMLADYSAVNANTPRAKEVRSYPWGDVAGKSAVWNRQWQRLRELVVEFASGQHADPCPRAQHWGGSMDSPHGRMVPARCSLVTANTFYAVRAWHKR